MADRVEAVLEVMAPSLDELLRLHVFSSNEIRAIVKRRRAIEYTLQRRVALRGDFVRALHFELNLDELRRIRKKKMSHQLSQDLPHNLPSDFAGRRRIFFLFQRALQKFPDDMPLWHQFLDYAARCKSTTALGKAYAKVLQLHPTKPDIWIKAMVWEFDVNNNIDGARVLMQRALRMNTQSSGDTQALWLAFFKMEVQYVRRIMKREQMLAQANNNDDDDDDGDDDVKKNVNEEFLAGAIPRMLFERAIDSASEDSSFALKFLALTPQKDLPHLYDYVVDVIAFRFPNVPSVWRVRACIACRVGHTPFLREQNALALVQDALLVDGHQQVMYDMCLSFMSQRLQLAAGDRSLENLIVKHMQNIMQNAIKTHYANENMFIVWTQTLLQVSSADAAHNLLTQALSNEWFPHSYKLMLIFVDVSITIAIVNDTLLDALDTLQTSIKQCAYNFSPTQVESLLRRVVRAHILIHAKKKTHEKISKCFQNAIEVCVEPHSNNSVAGVTLKQDYIEWAAETPAMLSTAITFITHTHPLNAMLCQRVLSLLQRELTSITALREIAEKSITHYGAESAELWCVYIQAELHAGNLKAAQHLKWRATKTLLAPERLTHLLSVVA